MRSAAARACVEAAEAGAEVVRKAHRARAEHVFGIDLKGPIDLVTAVDHAAETAIVECLQRLQPAVPILAEERGMVGGSKTGCRFIVDPLDGTTNFAHGFPVFAVSIAYEEGGEVVAGAVLDPVREELFTAEAGQGARLNGAPIRVSPTADLQHALLATGFPYSREAMDRALDLFVRIMRRVRAVRRAGSAALDLCCVAAGRLDAFWEETLRAWDTAAGEVIVREAGGVVSDFEGRAFTNGGPNIAVSNGPLHPALLEILAEAGAARRVEAGAVSSGPGL
ncbi:MAG: inositol monophosphatase family protein [Acidobacteriota bacterium]|nr:inositol monophosphatase family protein [Acidobacteriota bacterium]